MDTFSLDDLKQIMGELCIDNMLLKKKIGYLESMIEQLRPKEGGGGEAEKEQGPLHQETKKEEIRRS